jgi:hypothetical protein
MDNIVEKIRKMLALASNSGATEAEAAQALEMATFLMAKHNIDQDALVEKREGIVKKTASRTDFDDKWHAWIVSAVALLNACRGLDHSSGMFSFVGRESNVDAAMVMLPFIVDQIERLYKEGLPRGMSKAHRANYRRTFKQACAARVHLRATEIMQSLRTRDDVAMKATGSRALVVVQSIDQQLEEAREWMIENMPGVTFGQARKSKLAFGAGTAAGMSAGDKVQINRSVTGKQLQIGRKP